LAQEAKKTPAIKFWKKGIVNHLWYSAQTCGENEEELLRTWRSLRFHVQNIHQWREKGIVRKCKHGALTEQQLEWTDWVETEDELRVFDKV
jgi:hypothetical protein